MSFVENLNRMITAGLGGDLESAGTDVAVGYKIVTASYSGTIDEPIDFTDIGGSVLDVAIAQIKAYYEGEGVPTPDEPIAFGGWDGITIFVSPTLESEDATQYSFDWDGLFETVYNGNLDASTGVLTSRYQKKALKDIGWERVQVGVTSVYVFRSTDNYTKANFAIDGICNVYRSVSTVDLTRLADHSIVFKSNSWDSNNRIVIRDDTFESVEDFVDFLTEAEAECATVFEDPDTYEMDPAEITTLSGQNYMWANSGRLDIEFKRKEVPGIL